VSGLKDVEHRIAAELHRILMPSQEHFVRLGFGRDC